MGLLRYTFSFISTFEGLAESKLILLLFVEVAKEIPLKTYDRTVIQKLGDPYKNYIVLNEIICDEVNYPFLIQL